MADWHRKRRLMELNGRTAVVTGAASGIGRGLARGLASAGMRVVLADIREEVLQQAVGELVADGAVYQIVGRWEATAGRVLRCIRALRTLRRMTE